MSRLFVRSRSAGVAAALLLFFSSSFFTASFVPVAAQAQVTPPAEVLMVGNSLSRGVGRNLRRLFRDDGIKVKIRSRTPSGYRLFDHVHRKPVATKIAQRSWDFVVLQEQSDGIDEDRYPFARDLDALISANGSRTMFFMTWRRRGDPPAAYDDLKGQPGGNFGYVPIAFELDAPLAPVGWAFRQAVVNDPAADLWGDAAHANKRGRYLAASVIYVTMRGQPSVGNRWSPGSIDENDALSLRQLADATVLDDPSMWNLALP